MIADRTRLKRYRAGVTLSVCAITIAVALAALRYDSKLVPLVPAEPCVAHRVLIMRTSVIPRDTDALEKWPHRAAMVSEPSEVCQLERMMRWGKYSSGRCGYDTEVSFWDTPREEESLVYHVERGCKDPGTTQKLLHEHMRFYYDQMAQQPSHFIYLVALPPERSLDGMEQAFRQAGYTMLHWNPPWGHHPYLVVRAPVNYDLPHDPYLVVRAPVNCDLPHDAEEAWTRNLLFEPLKRCCGMRIVSDDIPLYWMRSGKLPKETEWFFFAMPPDADLSAVPAILSAYGAEAEYFVPERPRQVAVVLREPSLERVAAELKRRLPFILSVERKPARDGPMRWDY